MTQLAPSKRFLNRALLEFSNAVTYLTTIIEDNDYELLVLACQDVVDASKLKIKKVSKKNKPATKAGAVSEAKEVKKPRRRKERRPNAKKRMIGFM